MPTEAFSLPPLAPLAPKQEDPLAAMGYVPSEVRPVAPEVISPLPEPRTATEEKLGIGDPIANESLEPGKPLTETLAANQAELVDLDRLRRIDNVPGAKAMLDFGTTALNAVDAGKNGYTHFVDIRNSPLLKGISEGIHTTSEKFRTFIEARNECATEVQKRGSEYGFKGTVAPAEVTPVATESVPVAQVELSQPTVEMAVESKEVSQLSTPERIRQVFTTIEEMNSDGGKFDQFTATLKRFQEEYGQPEIAEAAITQLFGENAEIVKAVLEQGLDGLKKFNQDLEVLGVSSATAELAWKKRLTGLPKKVEIAAAAYEQTVEEVEEYVPGVESTPVLLTPEQQTQKRQQEIREQLRHGEGISRSDLSLQAQGSLLSAESARLRLKLQSDPADELGSYYRQSERIGKTERQFEGSYAGDGEPAARLEAALADITLKTEVLSLFSSAQTAAGQSGDALKIFKEKMTVLLGASIPFELQGDTDADGQPLKSFEPGKNTLGIEYRDGFLTVAVKQKSESDASTESTLQSRSVYTKS